MRRITVDIPFGFSFALRTRVPGVLSVEYSTRTPKSATRRNDDVSMESSIPPYPEEEDDEEAERESHQMHINIPPPPSPQLTEKAYTPHDFENQQAYHTQQLKTLNIPARDFAFEPYPNDRKAPEVFDPCLALLKFGTGVKMGRREVRRLVEIGWLTEEQVQVGAGFTPEEWDESVSPKEYPWIPLRFERPTGTPEEMLECLRRQIDVTYPGRKKNQIFESATPFDVNVHDDDTGQLPPIKRNDKKRSLTDDTAAHTTDVDGADELSGPLHKRRKLSPDPRDDNSISSNPQPCSPSSHNAYFAPSQNPSSLLKTSSSIQPHPAFTKPANAQPRGLARTQTLRTF
jgi:hypothetical protein